MFSLLKKLCSEVIKILGLLLCFISLHSFFDIIFVAFISLYDLLNDLMAHDISVAQIHEAYSVNAAQNLSDMTQPRGRSSRQVDLRNVSRNDSFRAEAQSRQKHFHLFGRGVLSLVKDYETLVEGAAAHVSQRNDLDNSLVGVTQKFLRREQIIERII